MIRRLPVVVASLALSSIAARADDLADLQGLLDEPVVSVASRSAESAATAPATTTTITADELRTYGIRSLDEALDFLSMGMVTEHPLATVELNARGVMFTRDYGNHVLLLVDGHAINEQWGGTAYFDRGAGISIDFIDHIEVILGPGSVLYGSNAMLGVINIVTRRPREGRGVHMALEGGYPHNVRGAISGGHEFRAFNQSGGIFLGAELFTSKGPWFDFGPQDWGLDSVTGEGKRFTTDGGPDGIWGGRARKTPYAQAPSAWARVDIGNFSADLRGSQFSRATPATWGTFDDPTNNEHDRWLSTNVRYSADLSRQLTFRVRGYADVYDYTQNAPSAAAEDCLEGQDNGCIYRLLGRAAWGGVDTSNTIDWLQDGSVVTLVGLDARLRRTGSSEIYDNPDATRVTEDVLRHVELAYGAYAEQSFRPTWWLALNAGGRLDFDQRFGAHLSPRLVGTLSPLRGTSIKGIYSEAFRAPTAYERYYSDPTAFLPAPDLEPEVVRSLETALEQRFGAQRIHMSIFRSWWSDFVTQDTATPEEVAQGIADGTLVEGAEDVGKYRNKARVDALGVNGGVEGSFFEGRIRHGMSFTVARARARDTEDAEPVPLPAAAQVFGNARLSWHPGKDLPSLGIATRWVGPRPVTRTGFNPAPLADPQMEVRVTVNGPVPMARWLSYRVGGNLSTARFAPYGVGPLESATETYTRQELSPVKRFELFAGLYFNAP